MGILRGALGVDNQLLLGGGRVGEQRQESLRPAENFLHPGRGAAGGLAAADFACGLNDRGVVRKNNLHGQLRKGFIPRIFTAVIQCLHPGILMKKAVYQILKPHVCFFPSR